jgi:hypothetical protein
MILHISQTSYFFIWEKFLKKLDKIVKIVCSQNKEEIGF